MPCATEVKRETKEMLSVNFSFLTFEVHFVEARLYVASIILENNSYVLFIFQIDLLLEN